MPKYAYSPSDEKVIVKPYYLNDINLEYTLTSGEHEVRDSAVIDAITYNILFTLPGERPFEPDFGSDLIMLLHEKMTARTGWRMENEVAVALMRWHPYIIVNRPQIIINADFDRGVYSMTLPYIERTDTNPMRHGTTFEIDLYTAGN